MNIKYERTVEVSPGEWQHSDVTAIIHEVVDTMRNVQLVCSCNNQEQRMSSGLMCINCTALVDCINMLVLR